MMMVTTHTQARAICNDRLQKLVA